MNTKVQSIIFCLEVEFIYRIFQNNFSLNLNGLRLCNINYVNYS